MKKQITYSILYTLFIVHCTLFIVACGASVPERYSESKELPKIYPDVIDVTIPQNIAPLTFELDDEKADGMIARYLRDGIEVVCEDKMQPSMSDWQALTAKPGDISVDVFVRHGEEWTHHKPFSIHVSADSIDSKDYSKSSASEPVSHCKELKYNIYKKSFDPETMQFGPRELVFAADTLDQSAVLPRISPDGRYMVFTMAKYGYFHIWHHDADLWVLDLTSGEAKPITAINSNDTESYHTWSSNGHWLVFSSRRDDGTYTRPFFAHMDKDGKWGKPFELPQADPDYHRQFLRSYNIPELMKGPVEIAPQTFADVLKGDGEPVKYVQRLSK